MLPCHAHKVVFKRAGYGGPRAGALNALVCVSAVLSVCGFKIASNASLSTERHPPSQSSLPARSPSTVSQNERDRCTDRAVERLRVSVSEDLSA